MNTITCDGNVLVRYYPVYRISDWAFTSRFRRSKKLCWVHACTKVWRILRGQHKFWPSEKVTKIPFHTKFFSPPTTHKIKVWTWTHQQMSSTLYEVYSNARCTPRAARGTLLQRVQSQTQQNNNEMRIHVENILLPICLLNAVTNHRFSLTKPPLFFRFDITQDYEYSR